MDLGRNVKRNLTFLEITDACITLYVKVISSCHHFSIHQVDKNELYKFQKKKIRFNFTKKLHYLASVSRKSRHYVWLRQILKKCKYRLFLTKWKKNFAYWFQNTFCFTPILGLFLLPALLFLVKNVQMPGLSTKQ